VKVPRGGYGIPISNERFDVSDCVVCSNAIVFGAVDERWVHVDDVRDHAALPSPIIRIVPAGSLR
jgi:hypothetical protein